MTVHTNFAGAELEVLNHLISKSGWHQDVLVRYALTELWKNIGSAPLQQQVQEHHAREQRKKIIYAVLIGFSLGAAIAYIVCLLFR